MTPRELAVIGLLAGSVLFTVVAAVGLVRLPDVYARAHATSKSDTLGTGFALAAVALVVESTTGRLKLVALVCFVLVTNPVAAHALTRAARRRGVPAWCRDEGDADERGTTDRESTGSGSTSGGGQ